MHNLSAQTAPRQEEGRDFHPLTAAGAGEGEQCLDQGLTRHPGLLLIQHREHLIAFYSVLWHLIAFDSVIQHLIAPHPQLLSEAAWEQRGQTPAGIQSCCWRSCGQEGWNSSHGIIDQRISLSASRTFLTQFHQEEPRNLPCPSE